MDISKSKQISHFAHNPTRPTRPTQSKKAIDVKPIAHPIAARVEKLRTRAKGTHDVLPTEKSAKVIKQEAIKAALSQSGGPIGTKMNFFKRNKKYVNIFSITAFVLIVIGSLIYVNLTNISVSVASMQAGINASFPEYYPDGYSVHGPVSYTNGQVTINFHANTGEGEFVIKQSRSPLDSSALKIQVDKESNNQTSQSQEGGLTIYTYNDNNNAAWVNGGILYSISGNAKLSSAQIRHIATSL